MRHSVHFFRSVLAVRQTTHCPSRYRSVAYTQSFNSFCATRAFSYRWLSTPTSARTSSQVSVTDHKGSPISIDPIAQFDQLSNCPVWLTEALSELKYPSLTSIQQYTIPALNDGHDLIGLAPTGSGKTIAFAVPALAKVSRTSDGSPSVLVLAPTRELVQQTTEVFERLSRGAVRVCEAYGGFPRDIQARRLHSGCEVLVACPGRLKDFLDAGDVSLKNLQFLAFDEADRLLDMGFQVQLDEIVSHIDTSSQSLQRMMWSATWPHSVQALARTYLSEKRLLIRAGTAGTGLQVNEHIQQNIIFATRLRDRVEKLAELIESGKIDDSTAKLILFVERQTDTENASQALSRRLGIDSKFVGVIHGGLSQRQRDSVMRRFKTNQIRLLVATDVASRGLDIPDVTCVVNFQAPKNIDSYCHRIGRTGRAGRTGEAYTFLSDEDGGIASELVDYLNRCKMDVPQQLTDLATQHRRLKSQSQSRSSSNWGSRSSRRFASSNNRNFHSVRRSSGAEESRNSSGWAV